TWTFVERPAGSQATLNDAHLVRPTFVPDIANDPGDAEDVYKLRLQVWDGVFWSTPDEMTVKAGDGNLPPSADAGDNAGGTVGATVWLDGSGSLDGEGSTVLDAYKWSFVATPDGFFGGLNNDAIVNPSFAPTVDGAYKIQLEVWDGEFWSAPDEVEITVGAGNQVPEAEIKGDGVVCDADTSLVVPVHECEVDERAPVITLDGSASVDEDPDTLLFEWAFTSKPAGSNAAFNDPTLANPSFVPDLYDPNITEDYVIRLRVWDGEFWSDSVAISINVTTNPNHRPTAVASFVPADPTADDVCEDEDSDTVVGQVVHLSDSITAGPATGDLDSDPLTYEWTLVEIPTGSLASLNDATVEDPSLTPDVNTGALEAYTVRLRVYDGSLWSKVTTDSIATFTAGCGNTAPVADAGDDRIDETNGGSDNSVGLGIVQLDGCDSSDADGDPLSYTWQFYKLPEASDAVLNNTGVCNPSFDADEVGFYSLRLQVDDGDLASGWDYVTIEAQ
ncbi:MAG: hypothetical protein JRI25_17855, partial [Deltaproteobacteria bacterium]|nr:hypothetical protein [Deltaproteobacteria bacterium]